MKVAVCILALLGLAAATEHFHKVHKKVADKMFVQKQKQILELVWRMNQPTINPTIVNVANTYDIQANLDKYTNVEAVKNFWTMYKRGMLPQGEVFSVLYEPQKYEMISIFDLFFYAKDFDTFYKTAAWARVYLNAGQFYYAFSVAVLHREDTQGIVLPAAYEIYPQLFIDSKVLQMAYEKRMTTPVSEYSQEFLIPVNKTGMYPYYQHVDAEKHYSYGRNVYGYDSLYHTMPEDRLAYFTEDIALNSYYNYLHLDTPFWMNATYKYNTDYRGEYFYYAHQQLLARYVLERFSNDLHDVEVLDFEEPIEHGYNPDIRYPNGLEFPVRADHTDFYKLNEYDIELIHDFEYRIREAIDLGYLYTKEGEKVKLTEERGMDLIGKMLEGTVDSVHYNYYGKVYQLSLEVLGHIFDHQVVPGVLENYETLLRDPVYYRLLARINRIFLRYKSLLPRYVREDLLFPGVKVESVEVDKLNTFFDEFVFDISSSLLVNKIDEELIVKAKQYRINHKPFNFKINVNSDKDVDTMVRVFIGPKYDTEGRVFGLNEKRRFMVELDRFTYKLVSGQNAISHNSNEIFNAVPEVRTIRDLYNQVEKAFDGKEQFEYDETDRHCGFPHRLLLPKGKRGGMPFTFYVTVTPLGKSRVELPLGKLDCTTGFGLYHPDQFALGFPFDRMIDETQFYVPNFFEKDVIIFHKRAEELANLSN